MKVFVVNGQGAVGKSLFENTVSKFAWTWDRKTVRITSMIDGIKEVAKEIGWNGDKSTKGRKFLSDFKDLCDEYNDFSFNYVRDKVRECEANGTDALFIDARQPEDIKRLVSEFNAKTVLVMRGEPKTYGNHADDDVYSIDYDLTIHNDGDIDRLKDSARIFYLRYILNNWEEK